jgi:hypothetical protein
MFNSEMVNSETYNGELFNGEMLNSKDAWATAPWQSADALVHASATYRTPLTFCELHDGRRGKLPVLAVAQSIRPESARRGDGVAQSRRQTSDHVRGPTGKPHGTTAARQFELPLRRSPVDTRAPSRSAQARGWPLPSLGPVAVVAIGLLRHTAL